MCYSPVDGLHSEFGWSLHRILRFPFFSFCIIFVTIVVHAPRRAEFATIQQKNRGFEKVVRQKRTSINKRQRAVYITVFAYFGQNTTNFRVAHVSFHFGQVINSLTTPIHEIPMTRRCRCRIEYLRGTEVYAFYVRNACTVLEGFTANEFQKFFFS